MAMFLAGSVPFAADSGAYLVESNLGRFDMFPGPDPTITSYRASAAVARYSAAMRTLIDANFGWRVFRRRRATSRARRAS